MLDIKGHLIGSSPNGTFLNSYSKERGSLFYNMDDFELIEGCVLGNKQCWDEFVEKFSRLIFDSILRTFRKYGANINNDVIDDLHNDIFVILLKGQCKALKEYEGRNGCSLASYLRTISVRRTIDYLRKQRPTVSIDQEIDTEEGKKLQFIKELSVFDDSYSFNKEDAKKVVDLVFAELKEEEKKFCSLCFMENKNPEDLAKLFNISVDNVYVRKQRMLNRLKQIVKDKKIC